MRFSYLKSYKLAILLSGFIAFGVEALGVPSDNDETYKLPAYIPQAAQPKNGKKIIFKDDNDEVYAAPQAQSQPHLNSAAQADYQRRYAEYQKQMQVYNQQMAEYKKNLAARQGRQVENDSTYSLPGQYRNTQPQSNPPQPSIQYQQHYDYNDQNSQLPDSVYY